MKFFKDVLIELTPRSSLYYRGKRPRFRRYEYMIQTKFLLLCYEGGFETARYQRKSKQIVAVVAKEISRKDFVVGTRVSD